MISSESMGDAICWATSYVRASIASVCSVAQFTFPLWCGCGVCEFPLTALSTCEVVYSLGDQICLPLAPDAPLPFAPEPPWMSVFPDPLPFADDATVAFVPTPANT